MEVNSNNIINTSVKPLGSLEKKVEKKVEKKSDNKIDEKKLVVNINTKDYLKIDTTPKGSIQVYNFLESENNKQTFSINIDKPKADEKVKANYDKDKKIATVESNDDKLATKTVIDEKSQLMTTEITTKDQNTNFKVTGGYNAKDSQLKTLGVESVNKDTNIKALYDPQKANIAGEIKQKIGNQDIKIKTDYDFKGSDIKNFAVESTDKDTNLKTLYNTQENSLSAEIIEQKGNDKYKFSGKYNLGLSNLNQFGVEYGNDKGLKVNTDYSENATNKDMKFKVLNKGFEFGTNFDIKNNFALSSIEVAKPVTFGKNLPTAKFSAEYDNQKNDFKKLAVDLNANIDEKVTVTFSSNLAQSVKQHSVKLNYDVYTNTKIGIEANLNEIKRDNSGYKLTFSSGFRF